MKTISVDFQGHHLSFDSASQMACEAAMQNQIQVPTIISWHDRRTDSMSPFYLGANSDTWWEKYGFGNGGKLEIKVGNDFEFVMMDTRGYETLDEIPLRNLTDGDGNEYVCYAPMLADNRVPHADACTPLDEWTANQY